MNQTPPMCQTQEGNSHRSRGVAVGAGAQLPKRPDGCLGLPAMSPHNAAAAVLVHPWAAPGGSLGERISMRCVDDGNR